LRVSLALSLAMLAMLLACGRDAGDRTPLLLDLAPLVPQTASLPGWSIVEGPTEYLPDSLFEVLDGGAPVYHAYGFRRLLRVRYQLRDDPLACITLDLFDMGTSLGAFGIFRSALPAAVPPRPWGSEAYRFGAVAAAWKGAVYVHGEADADLPVLIDTLELVVAQACGAVAGGTGLPAILAPLPREHLEAGSERYVARDLLGHEFLVGGVVASYLIDGSSSELFFSELANPSTARAAFVRLRNHYSAAGAVTAKTRIGGEEGFRVDGGVSGTVTVVHVGRFVAGIRGGASASHERLLRELASNLKTAHVE